MTPPSPTRRLLVGLGVTLAAVAVFSLYALFQIQGLRRLQSETVDRNHKDSLQLVRIQNNLHALALSMRDMIEGRNPYPLDAYQAEFQRLRADLDDALRLEGELSPAERTPAQAESLRLSAAAFWEGVDAMFQAAREGREKEAREIVRNRLLMQQAALTTTIARLLVANNDAEERAAAEIAKIYQGVERSIYRFLAAALGAIAVTSLVIIRANRRIFDQLASLSTQRQTLARKLISVQEDLFRSMSRELHDEFGQILTAVGAILSRAEKKGLPEDSPLRGDLREVREVAHQTLEKLRSVSQTLHPNVLDDFGLEKTLEWYVGQVRKQTGLAVQYERKGDAPPVPDEIAIHVYRIVQESLNNVARHAGVTEAALRVTFHPGGLSLEVEDHGKGMPEWRNGAGGLGLVAMRERAELMGGSLRFERPMEGGTRVSLEVPLGRVFV
ncbi:MAG TPA: sensor histidine kinase [Solibacterales bacterium]|nr:sensor histidine kinase [Bryobacterales bacterium]